MPYWQKIIKGQCTALVDIQFYSSFKLQQFLPVHCFQLFYWKYFNGSDNISLKLLKFNNGLNEGKHAKFDPGKVAVLLDSDWALAHFRWIVFAAKENFVIWDCLMLHWNEIYRQQLWCTSFWAGQSWQGIASKLLQSTLHGATLGKLAKYCN